MALRKYRNSAARTLAAPIPNSSTTSMTVDSATGFPTQFPYTLIIDPDGTLEEVVDVTGAVGNVLTVTRGVDGTAASAHAAGVRVVHGVSARDFAEANQHVNDTANVHGTTGFIVDTDSTQTVVGQKTFTGGLKTTGGNVIDTASVQSITGAKTFTSLSTSGGGAVVDSGSTQTVSGNKTFSGAVVNSGTVRYTHTDMSLKTAATTVDDSTSSATFTAGDNPVGVAFVAPPSGRILVFPSAWLQQDINNQTVIASFGIYTGSTPGAGTEVVAPSGDTAISIGGTVTSGVPIRAQLGRADPVVGLTPGAQYVATVMFQTTTPGTGRVFNRKITVLPLAG